MNRSWIIVTGVIEAENFSWKINVYTDSVVRECKKQTRLYAVFSRLVVLNFVLFFPP